MENVKMNNIEMRNVEKKDEINMVKKNNKQIEQLVQKYIEEYKQKGIPLEENEQAKKLLKYKLGLCLEIYKVEFSGHECVGKQEVHFIKQKGAHPDCYGNENGLTLTTEKDKWLKETAPKMVEGIKEYSPDNKYVGSMDDIYNYVSYLVNENKTDLDWANDSIPHEAMHIFGVIGGNSFLTEGITEELAREISEKYNLKMAPIGHSIEAEFVRKLESIVGRDAVIESGLMKNKNKDNPDFAEITTKEVTEKFDKIFGNGSLEKYVEELSKIQSELSQDVNLKDKAQTKIKDLMQPIDKYVEEKELNYDNEKYDNENHDYTNILKYQEEMLEYMKEIALEKNITQQIGKATINTPTKEKDEIQEKINSEIKEREQDKKQEQK